MSIKGSEAVGLKVLVFRDNTEIGTVKDIVYSPKQNKVIAFLIDEGEVLSEAKVIPIKEIKLLNKDGVFVKSAKSSKPASEFIKPLSDDKNNDSILRGARVINDKGEELGLENDLLFDPKKGTVEKFELLSQNKKSQIPVKKVIGSSESTTIIKQGKNNKDSKVSGLIQKITEAITK